MTHHERDDAELRNRLLFCMRTRKMLYGQSFAQSAEVYAQDVDFCPADLSCRTNMERWAAMAAAIAEEGVDESLHGHTNSDGRTLYPTATRAIHRDRGDRTDRAPVQLVPGVHSESA